MKPKTDLLASHMSDNERYFRMVFGVALLVLAVVVPTSWGWLGIYPLITGLMRITPVFKMLGIGPRG